MKNNKGFARSYLEVCSEEISEFPQKASTPYLRQQLILFLAAQYKIAPIEAGEIIERFCAEKQTASTPARA